MWPWSTIRQLRADAQMWERAYLKANDLWTDGHGRNEKLLADLSAARSDLDAMRRDRDDVLERWATLNERYAELSSYARDAQNLLETENARRRVAEEKLRLLTTRGPGGRFVKPGGVAGTSSGEVGH